MVYKHTNFNPITWWRPMAMMLGLLLVGSVSELNAQCDILVSSPDGMTTAPDGNMVDYIDLSPSLDNNGMATLNAAASGNRITSTGSGCSAYIFNTVANPNSTSTAINFNCNSLPGASNDASGSFYFVRINDGTVANNSSYTGIRITQVMDNLGPIVTPPSFAGIDCSVSPVPANTNGTATATDNCTAAANITITYSDAIRTQIVGRRDIIRTWKATDSQGNMGTSTQIIRVTDNQAPTFTDPDGSGPITLSGSTYGPTVTGLTCGDALPAFTPTATDNCGSPVITSSVSSGKGNNPAFANFYAYTVTRNFVATDGFGRTTSAVRSYRYDDTKAPVFTSVQSTLGAPSQVGTTNEYSVSGNIVLSPNPSSCQASVTYAPAATDDCAPTNQLVYSYEAYTVSTSGQESFFGSGAFTGGNFTIGGLNSGADYRIRIKVRDVRNNESFVDTRVEVLSTNPVITCTAAPIQITLNSAGSGFVTAAQILGTIPGQPCTFNSLTIDIRDVADGAVVLPSGRTSGTGNSSTLSSVAGNARVNFNCSDVGSARQIEVKVTNNNGGSITCTRQVQVMPSSTISLSASTTVVGSSAPGTSDGKITVTTGGSVGPFTYTYSGPMSGTVTGGSPTTISGLVTGTYSVTVSTNNGCASTTVSNIFVPVDDPITLSAVCPNAFTGGTIAIPIRVSDFDNINSTEFTVTLGGGLTAMSAAASNLPDVATVNVVNNTQVTFSWFLQNMSASNASVTRNDGTTILTINAQVPNTAGNYSVTINGSQTQLSATQNQGAGAAASTPVSVIASNCSGTIQTSPASVNGSVNFFSPTGNGVNGVTMSATSMTTATGTYSIQATPNSNITVTPTRPHTSQAQLLDGVNGGDLVQIQRRILGLSNTLSGDAYKTVAADANGNNTVDGGDLVRIQRAILGLETSFAVPSWRFVNAAQTISNPDNPFAGLMESYTNANLNSAVTVNFIGIKVGDVDGSAAYPYKLTSEEDDSKATNDDVTYRGVLPIQVKEQKLKAGELYEVKFTAKDFQDVLTYQTTIEFDTDVLTFVDVTTNDALTNLSEANFGLQAATEGMLTTLWYNAIEQSLADGTEVFTLRFRANEEEVLSRALRFTSNGIPQMAMGKDYEVFNVDLNFENAITPTDKFDLEQNQPNPFIDETVVSFELTEGGATTLTIVDVKGQVIKTYQQDFTQGYHEIKVSRTDVPSAGVYFYQLTTAKQQSAIRKMIVID